MTQHRMHLQRVELSYPISENMPPDVARCTRTEIITSPYVGEVFREIHGRQKPDLSRTKKYRQKTAGGCSLATPA